MRESQRLRIESDREKHQKKLELARITAQLSPTRRSAQLTADYYNDDYEQSRDNTVTFRYGDVERSLTW